MLSTIRLFKAVPVPSVTKSQQVSEVSLDASTIPSGFIFDPDVTRSRLNLQELAQHVNTVYGRNAEQLNQTFHKSFATVRDTPMEVLVLQQITHYLTTYGAEHFGIFKEENVYIPAEVLDIPELQEGLPLVVIRGLTKAQLKAELVKFLSLGVALSQQTIEDVLEVATFVGLNDQDIKGVKNKEVRASLMEHLGILPSDPQEFLRYVVYKATEQSLLIKSPGLLAKIKERQNTDVARDFVKYEQAHGLEKLASVFFRYKPIFLAFKTNATLKTKVNKIRKLANEHHRPLQQDLLNTLTAKISRGERVKASELQDALNGATLFRKARLAYALKFRLTNNGSVLYRIRNGKSYAKEFSFDSRRISAATTAYELVVASIITDLAMNVSGKKIYIPTGLNYGLPATEKQFTGNLPSGTFATVEDNMVVGVHWENQDGPRGGKGTYQIDLDLSMSNASGKIGWDGSYRSGSTIFFSGDLTNAPLPQGATEVFHIGAGSRGSWLLNLNYYNFSESVPVPFKVLVARETERNVNRNYTVNPNKIVVQSFSQIDVKQKSLGLIVADDESTRYYFAESQFANRISSRHTNAAEHARQFLLDYYTNAISLNDLLVRAGAELVSTPEEADIDLSPETVDKTTILSLLAPVDTPALV